MLDERHLPRLTLPGIPLSLASTPHDLKRLLYSSGTTLNRKQFTKALELGRAGEYLPERVEVVIKIHDFIEGKLVGGGSPETAKNQVFRVTNFFKWASEAGISITVLNLKDSYLQWAEHLHHRWTVVKDLARSGAYSDARDVGSIVDYVLNRNRCIVNLTRLRRPSDRKSPQGLQAERQNLTDTFAFGHILQDICDGLPLSVIWKLRIQIPLRSGGIYEPWTGGSKNRTKRILPDWENLDAKNRQLEFESDCTDRRRGRQSVINLRISAELLTFIGQTSMNPTQASKLKLRHYSYSSDVDGYKVRDYKARRHGETLFEIYSEYRPHFERYLEWRRNIFPNNDNLFPTIKQGALETALPRFDLIKKICQEFNVPWVTPRELRATRVNWMLRRTGDPDLTAEVAQHQKQTLLNVYERPSLHRALGEITRFWLVNDPTLAPGDKARSVAPGQCDGHPAETSSKPVSAPSPDCLRPSGCLWCEHHRDIDTQDYVWSLACFRHLKILEVSKHAATTEAEELAVPAQHAINKLSEKLSWFKESNPKRKNWVEEALTRVEDENYHSEWGYLIMAMEGSMQ